jgi:hypothetical protein
VRYAGLIPEISINPVAGLLDAALLVSGHAGTAFGQLITNWATLGPW